MLITDEQSNVSSPAPDPMTEVLAMHPVPWKFVEKWDDIEDANGLMIGNFLAEQPNSAFLEGPLARIVVAAVNEKYASDLSVQGEQQ